MKSVLVTGGTVRLGLAIADHLRDCGYKVITTSSRGESAADIVVDFRDPMGAAKCYAAALELLGGNPPDAVVNNAALFTGADSDIEAVNLTAPKKLTMLMSGRETAGRGCVVNILDATQGAGSGRSGKYGECKRELRTYTRTAAAMFSETLRVNAVSPGPVAGLAPVGVHEKAEESPLGRPRPVDIAKAVAFLIENESVTGIDIPVDGGLSVYDIIS